MKYEKPEMELIELMIDVITSSMNVDDELNDNNSVGFPKI